MTMMRIVIFLFGFWYVSFAVEAQDEKKFYFLGEGSYFHPLVLDPTESLSSGAIYKTWENGKGIKGAYFPVNLGFHQSLLRVQKQEGIGYELGVEVAAFTQFEVKYAGDGKYLGGMVNVDYRATGFINYYNHRFSLRFRLFHISSHLADDYLIRNDITTPTPNTLNYEQIDVTASFQQGMIRYYAGAGYIFTPNSIRKRFSTQAGIYYRRENNPDSFARFISGVDIKIFEENDYRPNFRVGIGLEMGNPERTHLMLMLDYYNGHLPYSTHEFREISWLGISCIIIPKRLDSVL